MAKGFGEASISLKKSSKSSSLMPAIDCEQIQKQMKVLEALIPLQSNSSDV
jgi:hypothetical protein